MKLHAASQRPQHQPEEQPAYSHRSQQALSINTRNQFILGVQIYFVVVEIKMSSMRNHTEHIILEIFFPK